MVSKHSKEVFLHKLILALLYIPTCAGLVKPSQYSSLCKSPLGMTSGAIDDIKCDINAAADMTTPCATSCEDVRYNSKLPKSYWCNTVDTSFKVTFKDPTILSGIVIRSACEDCKINSYSLKVVVTLHPQKMHAIWDGSKKFIQNTDGEIFWLHEPLIVLGVRIRPKTAVGDIFKIQMEYFGCSYWEYYSPIGFESGMIENDKLSSICINDLKCQNTHSGRLNSAQFYGWLVPPNTDLHKAYLQLNLNDVYTISSLVVQYGSDQLILDTALTSASYTIRYRDANDDFVNHGLDLGDRTETILKTIKIPFSTTDGNEGRYVFKYPIFTTSIRFYPTVEALSSTFFRLEYYGQKGFIPSHHWIPHPEGILDDIGYRHFALNTNKYVYDGNRVGFVGSSSFTTQVKTPVFGATDCIVNPGECVDGFSMSFNFSPFAFNSDIATSSFPSTLIASYVDHVCRTDVVQFRGLTAIYIDNIEIYRNAMLFGSPTYFISYSGDHMAIARANIKIYVGKGRNFVENCIYKYFGGGQEIATLTGVYLKFGQHGEFNSEFQSLINSQHWRYGNSMVLVIEIDVNQMGYLLPEYSSMIFDLEIYHKTVCERVVVDDLGSLSENSFTEAPEAYGIECSMVPASVRNDGWKDCLGSNNYLKIDFGLAQTITLLIVGGEDYSYAERFKVYHGFANPSTLIILKNSDDDSIFKKTSGTWEDFYLPGPITTRYLKFVPVSHRGENFVLKLKIGKCVIQDKLVSDAWETMFAGDQKDIQSFAPRHIDSKIYAVETSTKKVLKIVDGNLEGVLPDTLRFEELTMRYFDGTLYGHSEVEARRFESEELTTLRCYGRNSIEIGKYMLCYYKGIHVIWESNSNIFHQSSEAVDEARILRLTAADGSDYAFVVSGLDRKLYKHKIYLSGRPAVFEGWHLVYNHYCKDICNNRVDGILFCLTEQDMILEYNMFTENMQEFFQMDEATKRILVYSTHLYALTERNEIKRSELLRGNPRAYSLQILSAGGLHAFNEDSGVAGYSIYMTRINSVWKLFGTFITSSTMFKVDLGNINWRSLTHLSMVFHENSNTINAYRDGVKIDVVRTATTQQCLPVLENTFISLAGFPYESHDVFKILIYDLKVWRRYIDPSIFFIPKFMDYRTGPINFNKVEEETLYRTLSVCPKFSMIGESAGPCFDAGYNLNEDRNKKSYYIISKRKVSANPYYNYHTGVLVCKESGGHPAIIKSQTEWDEIESLDVFLTSPDIFLGYYNESAGQFGDYMEYNNFDVTTNDDAYHCVSYSPVTFSWKYTDCEDELQFLCEAEEKLSQMSFTLTKHLSFSSSSQCQETPGDENVRLYSFITDKKFTLFNFGGIKLPDNIMIKSAYFFADEALDVDISTKETLYISVMQPYFGCDQIESMDEPNIACQPYNIKTWELNIEKTRHITSPDISEFIHVIYGLTYPRETALNLILVVFRGNQQRSADVSILQLKNINLVINYIHRPESNYLLFNIKDNPPAFPYEPFKYATEYLGTKQSVISFWYYMAHGTMYVFSNNNFNYYPVLVAAGKNQNIWKKATFGKEIEGQSRLEFLVYTNDMNAIVAIDHIESSHYITGVEEVPEYYNTLYDNGDDWLVNFEKRNLPEPTVLYPFDSKDSQLQNALSDMKVKNDFVTDKYGFENHATKYKGDNAGYLTTGDISGQFSSMTSFTMMFHLKLPTQLRGAMRLLSIRDQSYLMHFVGAKLEVHDTQIRLQSADELSLDVWHYVVITFKEKKMTMYVDLEVADVNDDFDVISKFTNAEVIHFFGDVGVPEYHTFNGYFSCFQLYPEQLDLDQITALEFCPNRLDTSQIPNCGVRSYFKPPLDGCVCEDEVKEFRYYNQYECKIVFQGEENVVTYYSFDQKDYFYDLKKQIPKESAGETYRRKSPVNYGRCIEDGDYTFISLSHFAVDNTFSMCTDGFVVSLWLYVEPTDSNTGGVKSVFTVGDLKIQADLSVTNNYVPGFIKWKRSEMEICGYDLLRIPLNAWIYTMVILTSSNFTIQMNEEIITGILNDICEPPSGNEIAGDGKAKFGNDGMIACIDELIIDCHGAWNEFTHKTRYDHITKGPWLFEKKLDNVPVATDELLTTQECANYCSQNEAYFVSTSISEDEETQCFCEYSTSTPTITSQTLSKTSSILQLRMLNQTDEYYPSFSISVLSDIQWPEGVLQPNSGREYVEKTYLTAVQAFLNDVSLKLKLTNASQYGDNSITGLIEISFTRGFERFHVEIFREPVAFLYEGRNFQMERVDGTEKGVPQNYPPEFTRTEYNSTAFLLAITNVKCIDEQYQKGILIHAVIIPSNNPSRVFKEVDSLILTGKNDVIWNGIYPWHEYYMQVWSVTHEGFSPVYQTNFTLPPGANVIPPNVISAVNTSTTTIEIKWEEYGTELWGGPFQHYRIYYKAFYTNDEFDKDDESGYAHLDITDLQYILTDLEIFTNYSLFVTTINDFGVGVPYHTFVRTAESLPEIAPVITKIDKAADNYYMLQFDWLPLPEDIDLYNSWDLEGYYINITNPFPQYDNICGHLEFYVNDKRANVLQLDVYCQDSQIYNVYIGAYNHIGIGVLQQYCFVLSPYYTPGLPDVFETDISDITHSKATVNITMGGIPYENENDFILKYKFAYKSLDWEDDYTRIEVEIHHTKEEWEYFEASKQRIVNCSYIGDEPIKTAKYENITLDLHYYTNYMVQVKACGELWCNESPKNLTFLTSAHAPTCSPSDIQISDLNPTSLKIQYDSLDNLCLHGPLLNYGLLLFELDIYDQLVAQNASVKEIVSNATFSATKEDDSEHIFTGLEEYWNYTLLMYAENTEVNEPGVLSSPIFHITQEAEPGPPICKTDITHSEVKVIVKLPELRSINGIISEYRLVLYGHEDTSFSTITETIPMVNPSGDVYVFTDLMPSTVYNITVSAKTGAGYGTPFNLDVKTIEMSPAVAPEASIQIMTNDSVTFTWQTIPFLLSRGVLMNFYIIGCGLLANHTIHCVDKFPLR